MHSGATALSRTTNMNVLKPRTVQLALSPTNHVLQAPTVLQLAAYIPAKSESIVLNDQSTPVNAPREIIVPIRTLPFRVKLANVIQTLILSKPYSINLD